MRRLLSTGTFGHGSLFDKVRHKGKMNCLFADGHAETFGIIDKGIRSVYLNKDFD